MQKKPYKMRERERKREMTRRRQCEEITAHFQHILLFVLFDSSDISSDVNISSIRGSSSTLSFCLLNCLVGNGNELADRWIERE